MENRSDFLTGNFADFADGGAESDNEIMITGSHERTFERIFFVQLEGSINPRSVNW